MRLTLTLLTVGAIATAAYLFLSIHRTASATTAAARDLDARISTAIRLTLELRGAQQAYVAAGQSKPFWFTKAAATAAALRESLTGVRGGAVSDASHVPLDQALQQLQEFERMDRRARDFAAADQNLLASDLIFSDGLETTTQILNALDQSRLSETDALERSNGGGRRGQLMYAGAAAGIAIVTVLLLVSTPHATPIAAAAAVPPMIVPDSTEGLDLGDTFAIEPSVSRTPPSTVSAPGPDLEHVASVCAELARVSDTASLPSLLERTATALDASGVVLWLADPDGKELTAVASHGYPVSMLSRMGAIHRDADNVTATAFRTGLLQTVTADAMSNGAIAAPLVNPGGCIGVMSAEVRHDGEKQPARLAVATIVAAQLATLVAPPTARGDQSTAAL